MIWRNKLALLCILVASAANAHSTHADEETSAEARLILAAIERTKVQITIDERYRYIKANGIPNHTTGSFPNRGNPHSISSQNYSYRVPLNPSMASRSTAMQRQPFGVALNGIPFDPGTAECYGQRRGERLSPSECTWREEAIVRGQGQLGLDSSNAHVQPNGAYHYHGIPNGLLRYLEGDDMLHVGYAADGHKMMVSKSGAYEPSYVLKSGTRSSGPGGRHDGKYTQDFEYVSGSGALDACNGTSYEGEYVYILTESFPYIPRCWNGTPDRSFETRRGSGGMNGSGPQRRMPPPHHGPRHHRL